MEELHRYTTHLDWTGNLGSGTSSYRSYSRSHQVTVPGKPVLDLSSDPAFRGDGSCYNPEELFLASISSCHMLWYLHLCADAGIEVLEYQDEASGTLQLEADGSGQFTAIVLHPKVVVAKASMLPQAEALHDEAHRYCFIANSIRAAVRHEASCLALPLT